MAFFTTALLVASLIGSGVQAKEASDARKKQRQINANNRRAAAVKNARSRRIAVANQRRLTGAIRNEAALSGATGSSSEQGSIASVEAQTAAAIGQSTFEEGIGTENFDLQEGILRNQANINNIGTVKSVIGAASSFNDSLIAKKELERQQNTGTESFVKAGTKKTIGE